LTVVKTASARSVTFVKVERSLEQTTRHGYRFKAPKTRAGRREIPIPAETVEVLRQHRRQQLELRMSLGMGKLDPEALVFGRLDGRPLPPNHVTARWREAVGGRWKFHALRHTHASANCRWYRRGERERTPRPK
jgi:integrase